ncbi:MAG: hypoxanthine phosphoribosyltransferase [Verrucomicrobia bacterium]|nr:hypoxanthine phosphoribosyltransferase [Verrucomicrobiota bacterium]
MFQCFVSHDVSSKLKSKKRAPRTKLARVKQEHHALMDMAAVLYSEREILQRVKGMAWEIEQHYAGKDLVVVALLNGTVMFLADLVRYLDLPLRLDFMGVSSYGKGTKSGKLVFTKELKLDVKARDVLLVDDILDTGKTLSLVTKKLKKLKPRSLKICVLLSKSARREENVVADYVGFEIPDAFVVGYGLDFAERYRNLPFIGILKPKIYDEVVKS